MRVYSVPPVGTFFTVQNGGTNGAPLPYCPYSPTDVPVYQIDSSPARYLIDDSAVDLSALFTESESASMDSDSYAFPSFASYGSNDFYISLAVTNGIGTPIVHGAVSNYFYQIETNLDLAIWHYWTPGELLQDTDGTNAMYFSSLPVTNQPQEFFRAVRGQYRVYITKLFDSVEPNTSATNDLGVTGGFNVWLEDTAPTNLTVYYRISGSAQNGVDYTNLSGQITFTSGQGNALIWVQPIYDTLLEFDESVTITLIPTNDYVVEPTLCTQTHLHRG